MAFNLFDFTKDEDKFAELDKKYGFSPKASDDAVFAELDKKYGFAPKMTTASVGAPEPTAPSTESGSPFLGALKGAVGAFTA